MRPFKLQALQITTAKSLGFAQTRAAHKSFSHENKKKKQCTRWRPYRNFSPFSAFVDPLRRVKTPPCDQRVSLLREVSSWMGAARFCYG